MAYDNKYWNDKWPKAPIIYSGRALRGKKDNIGIDVKTFIVQNDAIMQETIKKYRLIKNSLNGTAYACQKFVVKFLKYKYDEDANQCPEFWQFPFETLQSGIGDCEDGGILMASLMINCGIPSYRVKVSAGYVQESPKAPQGGHAYCIYLADRSDSDRKLEWEIHDWCVVDNKRTLVSTPNGKKRISKLQEGDWIIGFNEDEKIPALTQIKKLGNRQSDNIYTIKFEHGEPISVTGEHPFYVKNNWVKADELKINDEVYWIKPQTLFAQFHDHKKDPWRKEAAMKTSKKNYELGVYAKLAERQRVNNVFTWPSVRKKLSENNCMKNPEIMEKAFQKRADGTIIGPESRFVEYCQENNLPVEFVGDGKFWIRTSDGSKNPDFRVPGTKKLIEVSHKDFEYYRNWEEYKINRRKIFNEKGFEVEFVLFDYKGICDTNLKNLHGFIFNGNKITDIYSTKKNTVWNMHCEPFNNYFINGNLVHNCYYEDTDIPTGQKPLAKNGGYKNCYKDVWFTFNNEFSWNQTALDVGGRVSEGQTLQFEEVAQVSNLDSIMKVIDTNYNSL